MDQPGDDDELEDEEPSESDDLLRAIARVPKVASLGPASAPGTRLGHFRIVSKLGEGGMGVVYRAEDEKLRRHVALKVLPESFAKDEERRRRFLREARSAASITHANVATVYDVGEADDQIFIAMELVEGETLRVRMDRGISVSEGTRVAREIARGLGRAHEKGIIHRDLKPENVMITPRDEVKILDFGLAKLREPAAGDPGEPAQPGEPKSDETKSNLTDPGRLLGTPAYASPEQARGLDVDARTDVFSFGVVLYEMVAGARPFGGKTTLDVITSALRDTHVRPSQHNPGVPAAVERIIDRCLEKEPGARFANGQELLDALSAESPEATVAEPSSVRRGPAPAAPSLITPGPSIARTRGRPPWRWGLVVLGGLGAVGLGWAYLPRAGTGSQGNPSITLANSEPSVNAPVSAGQTPAPSATPPASVSQPPTPTTEAASAPAIAPAQAAPVASLPPPSTRVAVNPRARAAPANSAASSTRRAPPRPKSPDELFDTEQ